VFGRLGLIGIVALAMVVVVSQTGGGKAAQATIVQSCPSGSDGGVTVALSWPAPAEGSFETWLDIGFAKDFGEGTYVAYGPFDPAQTSYALAGLPEGIAYVYRVQSRSSDGWHRTASGGFVTACAQPAIPGDVSLRCTEGPEPGPADDGVAAVFAWTARTAGEQWIDLSVAGGAFAAGTYRGHGPVASGVSSYEVAGLARDVTYHWRVNTRTPGGWVSSGPASFVTPPCPRP
jgi:hypothetical protein